MTSFDDWEGATLISYARVLTEEQTVAAQLDALRIAECERIVEETASGAKSDRLVIADAVSFARARNVVVAYKLDRVAPSVTTDE